MTSTAFLWWNGRGRRWRGLAVRTASPVGDFGFVDLVALVVGGRQAWRGAGRAVDIDDATADPADQVVVVVADAILVAGRGTGGLDATDQAFGDEHAQRVIDRLQRDGADFRSNHVRDAVGGDVRRGRHGAQDGEPLRGDLDAVFTKESGRVRNHESDYISNIGVIQLLTPGVAPDGGPE